MCSVIINPFDISRRTFLKGVGVTLAAAPFLNSLSGCSGGSGGGLPASSHNTRLVILGSSGGVSYWPNCERASSSSAIVVGNSIYLIDMGQGSTNRLSQAFNTDPMVNPDGSYTGTGSATFLQNVKALFLTHLHQDHIADYANFLLIGAGAGLGKPDQTGKATQPLQLIGPCNRGCDDKNNSTFPVTTITTDSATPSLQTTTPGTQQMHNWVLQAFAQAINDLMLDDNYPDYSSLVKVTEIGTPLLDPNGQTCFEMPPKQIYPTNGDTVDENGVSVWATLVDHHQVYPSFAFRFNTPDGSVVFSGDTGPDTRGYPTATAKRGNLQVLADGADILVHEVIDRAWVNYRFGSNPPQGTSAYTLSQHMLNAHTPIDQVGAVAESCHVKTLVLNHIVPGVTPLSHLMQAQKGFSGKLIVGEDLMQIGLGMPISS